jgi:hypothetical protein
MQPNPNLAVQVLPRPLYRAIVDVFAHGGEGVALVGGTAIAGFYAGHRRSDDMDLFTRDEISQRETVLAIKNLKKLGARITQESHTPLFYHAICELDGHTFTADAVLDENLFRVGDFCRVKPGILVAKLDTLLAMKMATLVSRSSEKDIFDLKWLLAHQPKCSTADLIAMAAKIDGGANAENMLASVGGANLRESACDFSLNSKMTKAQIFKEIKSEQKAWIQRLQKYLRTAPPPKVAALIKEVKRKKF